MELHTALALACLCCGLCALYVAAVWFDPAPIDLVQQTDYIDQTVVLQGSAKDVKQSDAVLSGTLVGACSTPFIHYTGGEQLPANTLQDARFIGTLVNSRNSPMLLVEEIKFINPN